MPAKSLQSCLPLCEPMDRHFKGSCVHGTSRQEHWSGLSCPPPGHLPDPGNQPTSLTSPALRGKFFTTNTLICPLMQICGNLEKQYGWPSLQTRNRHWGIESKCVGPKWGREDERNWEAGADMCVLSMLSIKWIAGENLLYGAGNSAERAAVTQMARKSSKEGTHGHSSWLVWGTLATQAAW